MSAVQQVQHANPEDTTPSSSTTGPLCRKDRVGSVAPRGITSDAPHQRPPHREQHTGTSSSSAGHGTGGGGEPPNTANSTTQPPPVQHFSPPTTSCRRPRICSTRTPTLGDGTARPSPGVGRQLRQQGHAIPSHGSVPRAKVTTQRSPQHQWTARLCSLQLILLPSPHSSPVPGPATHNARPDTGTQAHLPRRSNSVTAVVR
ncbi:hypothetical protein NDU88_002066 [Pleurodeles waltl]|uniref:Uncharacterized protein n=1 Tax=Pleurodeles waltl TaxID=8319 RepID=A0AAV7LZF2_PLEWA|nr:hypothetical protein NDU88_002066 [Pleurodeles waltl]